MRAAAFVLLAGLVLAGPAAAQDAPRVAMRVGNHAEYGRLVFDFATQTGYRVEQGEGRLTIRFASPARIDLAAAQRARRGTAGGGDRDPPHARRAAATFPAGQPRGGRCAGPGGGGCAGRRNGRVRTGGRRACGARRHRSGACRA
jgi:hypothetical protein